ncbi:hypothetical protein DCC39_10435 [Pueribacillus theae]|uniref:Uncharacterized protein n=1 Tax=Pueribacillus theae TaxID=2171751 RepID=A0A2U1K0T6_9BACI|nr:hypothetical protein [Pueribacillus theae]PWA11107.1 hypothetical protein DCC39_10435 [Pueribacillus theae]
MIDEIMLVTYAPYENWFDYMETTPLLTFPVKMDWLSDFLEKNYETTIDEFLREYNYDDSEFILRNWIAHLETRDKNEQ